jgi:hypothetical protein
MNKRLMLTVTLFGVGLLGLALVGPGAGLLAAMRQDPPAHQTWPCLTNGRWGMMSGWENGDNTGPGMMNGGGMMGGWIGNGTMWEMMGDTGMMGWYASTAQPIAEADAQQRLATFAAGCGSDVHVADVMAFASNYYAQLVDGSGAGFGEVIVDRYTGEVYPEPGPNMMWNSRWGMGPSGAARYDQAAAQQVATTFLAGYLPGATVLMGQAFPGYYTFDFGHGQAEGMLSVNAATGEVWVHTWHGPALPANN